MNERDIFLSALDVEDLSARNEYLQEACGEDAELLGKVQALLESHENASQFLNTPAVQQIAEESSGEDSPTVETNTAPASGNPDLAATMAFDDSESVDDEGEEMDDEIPLGFLQPSTRPDSLGRLGHYEIQEVIGRGAFGTVMKAFDEKLQIGRASCRERV